MDALRTDPPALEADPAEQSAGTGPDAPGKHGCGNPSEWGEQALRAKTAGAMKPAWNAFLKTKFVVPILRSADNNPRHYRLHLVPTGAKDEPTLIMAELRERLDLTQGDGIVTLSGADILRRLDDQGGMQIALAEGVFGISQRRAAWLRSGLEMATRKVGFRRLLQAAAPAAPLPVLRVAGGTELVAVPEPGMLERIRPLMQSRTALVCLAGVVLAGSALTLLSQRTEPTPTPRPFEAPNPVSASAVASVPGAVPASVPQERLMPFVPVDNSFTVDVAAPPEEVELSPEQVAQMDGLPSNHYRLLHDGMLFQMEVIQYAGRMPPDIGAAMDARQKMVVGADSLLDARPVSLRGALGRELRVRLPDGGERAARFVFSGEKFCMVTVSAPPGMDAARKSAAFLASFRLN